MFNLVKKFLCHSFIWNSASNNTQQDQLQFKYNESDKRFFEEIKQLENYYE